MTDTRSLIGTVAKTSREDHRFGIMTAPVLFVHRFTVLDYARVTTDGFEGESVYVDAELMGELDSRGFLMDFGPVKKLLKGLVDEVIDHRLAVPAKAPQLRFRLNGEQAELDCRKGSDHGFYYRAPIEAFAVLDAERVDDAAVMRFLEQRVTPRLPPNVREVRFSLTPATELEREPSFRYTHGLKLHEGNCQRLIHGHRNVIEVKIDGRAHRAGAELLADFFHNAHFVEHGDLDVSIPIGQRFAEERRCSVMYHGSQGRFDAQLPIERLLPMNCEPTVENIAVFAHGWISRQLDVEPSRVSVLAYEGLHKGAGAGLGFTC